MTLWQIAIRSLRHYWRNNFSIGMGVAAATAVLTGALIVGESMRKGLRDLTLERLGKIDAVLVSDGFFRQDLADEMAQSEGFAGFDAVPAILFPNGTVETEQENISRASNVNVIGVTPEFWGLALAKTDFVLGENQIAINQALRDELSPGSDDVDAAIRTLTLRIPKPTQLPSDSPLGKTRDLVQSLVGLETALVVSDQQMGRFGLQPSQVDAPNIYVPIEILQNSLSRSSLKHKSDSRFANVAFLAAKSAEAQRVVRDADAVSKLKTLLRPSLEDHGISVKRATGIATGKEGPEAVTKTIFDYWTLSSDRLVLTEKAVHAIDEAFPNASPVFTYLANDIRRPGTELGVPFSMIASIDFNDSFPIVDVNGNRIARIEDDEIVLNQWAVDDLGVTVGDEIEVAFFEPETTHGRQVLQTQRFKLAAVAKLAIPTRPFKFRVRRGVRPAEFSLDNPPTFANDWQLTPEVPGVTDAETIEDWDLPFKTDTLRAIDDTYWSDHRTTPKGFVSLAAGQALWGSRFGQVTSYRIPISAEGQGTGTVDEIAIRLQDQLVNNDTQLGFELIPVKANGLRASSGSTPFDALFLALSMFVIASALILVSLLFRLGLAERASEVGLLRASGFDSGSVLKLWLREMVIVCAAGAVIGMLLGIGYAGLMILGLKTWWVGAISRPFIDLYLGPISLIAGLLSGLAICVITIWWSLRRMRQISVRGLLAGRTTESSLKSSAKSGKRNLVMAVVLLLLAIGLSVLAASLSGDAQAGAFMGSGFFVLVAALLLVLVGLTRSASNEKAVGISQSNLAMMAAKRNPVRSTLTIGLVAVASFLIVAVSSFRLAPTDAGTAGFDWIGESSQSVFADLNSADGQSIALGVNSKLPENVEIYSIRFKPGQDASCNNLYQSTQPRVLGMPESFIERFDSEESSAFAWGGSLAATESEKANPWRLLSRDSSVRSSVASDEDPVIPCVIDKNTANYSLKIFAPNTNFTVSYDSGETVTFHVVGFLSNTILQGSMIVAEEDFKIAFPNIGGYRYFLIDDPEAAVDGESATATVTLLEDRLGDQGFDSRSAKRVLTGFMAVQNTYLSTFQALGALGLLLGTFGLAAVQMRNVIERKQEFGLLRAVGFAPGTLTSMVFKENAFLLLVGLLVGILAALCATLPHYWVGSASMPWAQLAIMFACIVVVGLLAGGLGARLINRLPLLESLRA